MLIEWLLEENGHNHRVNFKTKIEKLNNPLYFPQPITNYSWLIERLTALYKNLEPLRGTIVHDKHFTSLNGSINVSSSRRGQIGENINIDADCLRNLAVTIVSIFKYISGDWRIDQFREKVLRHALNEISSLHRLPLLKQKQPIHEGIRIYLSGSDPTEFDLTTVHKELAERYTDLDYSFDIQILMVRESKVVDAYLFTWDILASGKNILPKSINAQDYKTSIPENIDSEFKEIHRQEN